ncbi:MAG: hypothetical protein EA391_01610 [Balneolaceae bacterium]|nr:MAG: hypothetical protein EA391_01610 [Balneolaceae bacterium]
MIKSSYKRIRNGLKKLYQTSSVHFKDLKNKLRYGIHAPKYMERIWVNPMEISHMITKQEVHRVTGIHRNRASGVIVDWNKINERIPLMEDFRMQYCFKHWRDGRSWQEIGVFDYMMQTKSYGNWPLEKIKARYTMLDQAFQKTKEIGRLKTRQEINPGNFREEDGILVHIANDGEIIFGGNGFHRLAMAQVLELKQIPACLGLVDKKAISYLKKYRKA